MASYGAPDYSTQSSHSSYDSSASGMSPSNDWRARANGLVQNGVAQAKNNPGMTAAIVGGVAAAAAATVYRDRIGGAISSLRGGNTTDVSGMAGSSPIDSGGTTGSSIDSGRSMIDSSNTMMDRSNQSMMAGGTGTTL